MLLLTAVNEILPKLGERPVTSIEAKSPTLSIILPQIDAEIDLVLQTGWWFNTCYGIELFPDSEQGLVVPDDCLSFYPDRSYPDIVARDGKFYDTSKRSYLFTDKVRGTLIQRVGFEQLPESAARFILYSALVTIYATDIGLEQVVQLWRQYAQQAQANMEQEHLRHRHYSVKQNPRYARLRRAMRG
ncbi:tail protein [Ralstonia phage RSB3]|uniref:Putative tail tubular protein n=1 Tax=Ralstonia phage RSB3 TaxID=1402875 RepID=U3TK88_9CAUD|nr:tail protein [Ralstonia phage RSB3]BAN92348.1 putative tail tubular protein [Ralstonia phage RSB3]